MSSGVCFHMAIALIPEWDNSVYDVQNIVGDHWIGVLVNGDGDCGMGNIDVANTGFNTAIVYRFLDFVSDGNKFSLAIGAKFNLDRRLQILYILSLCVNTEVTRSDL